MVDELVHGAWFAKTHFDLGRMHIDIHRARINGQIQRVGRVAIAMEHVAVGLAQRVGDQFVAHEATVDEDKLQVA